MGDVILIIAVAAVMILGFFMMKRIDVFLEKNRKASEEEQEERCSSPIEFIDMENDENMISEIENFKKSHKTVAIVIFDGENQELTNILTDYISRK